MSWSAMSAPCSRSILLRMLAAAASSSTVAIPKTPDNANLPRICAQAAQCLRIELIDRHFPDIDFVLPGIDMAQARADRHEKLPADIAAQSVHSTRELLDGQSVFR